MTGQHAARGRLGRACRRVVAELSVPGPTVWEFVIWLQVSLWAGVFRAGPLLLLGIGAGTMTALWAVRALPILWDAARRHQVVLPEGNDPK